MVKCPLCAAPEVDFQGLSDEKLKIIKDIHPQNQTHFLVVPRKHMMSWLQDPEVLSHALHKIMKRLAGPYFLVMNEAAPYRTLDHCHIHLRSDYQVRGSPTQTGNPYPL